MGLNIEYEYVESGKKYNNNDNKFNEKSGETSERMRERDGKNRQQSIFLSTFF